MTKNTFIFNFDWADVLAEQPDDIRLEVYDAIMTYAKTGEAPHLQPLAKLAFSFIKKQMDRNAQNYDAMIQARSEAGRKGMAARWHNKNNNVMGVITNYNKDNNVTSVITKITSDNKNNYIDNDNDNENDIIKENEVKEKSQNARFAPPTAIEVKQYMSEYIDKKRAEGTFYVISPDLSERFVDFYTSKGWKVGRVSMKDWRAAARKWVADEQKRNKSSTAKNTINFEGENDRSVYSREAEYVKQLQGG